MSITETVADSILRTDDVALLTDRWGNCIAKDYEEAPQALLDTMWDEVCFVARRGGRLGMLIEVELVYPGGDDEVEDVQSAWGTLDPAVVDAALTAQVGRLSKQFPAAEFYVLVGNEVCMGRAALRAFVPEAACSAALSEAIGNALMARFGVEG